MWRLLSVVLLALPNVSGAAATATGNWAGFRAAVNQQSLQTVLVSIEERLRGLDNLYSVRYAPRLDLTMEQQARRLDSIESRLGRLETLLELRLDKLSETMSARQLKEELSKDQLSRKLDSNYERLNHRMGYMEARLDMGITKLQTTVEAGTSRIERLEMALGGRHGDMGADLQDVKNGLEDLKRTFQGCHNSTMTAVASGENTMKLYYDQLTSSLVQIHGELNRTLVQNDAEEPSVNDDAEKMLNAIERHASNFGTKVTNMYNEIWRRTQMLENVAKDSMSLSNATRRELQEGLRSISMQMSRHCCLQADRGKQSSLDMTLESLGGSLGDVSRKLDTYFQTLITTHEVILQNCHRLQKEEPLLEERLTQVLERMLQISSNNRCNSMGQELQELHELLKSHHTTVVRNVGHSTNTIMRAADNSSKDNRNLVDVIAEVREGLLASNTGIHDTLASIHQEQTDVNQAMDKITEALQEFQEQLAEMNAAGFHEDHIEKVTNTNISCPDSKSIATDVAAEIRKLTALANQQVPVPKTTWNITHEDVKGFLEVLISGLKENGMMILKKETEMNVASNAATEHMIYNSTNKSQIKGNNSHNLQNEDLSEEEEDALSEAETENENITNFNEETTKMHQTDETHLFPVFHLSTNISNMTSVREHPFVIQHQSERMDKNYIHYENGKSVIQENEKGPKSAEVTIKIIPHPEHFISGNQDPLLEGFNLENSSAMLEIDLNHVAAVIHSKNADIDEHGPQASVTIVHNDKPLTAEGQVKYSSTMDGNTAEIILRPIHHKEDNSYQEENQIIPSVLPVPPLLAEMEIQNNNQEVSANTGTLSVHIGDANSTLQAQNETHTNGFLQATTTPPLSSVLLQNNTISSLNSDNKTSANNNTTLNTTGKSLESANIEKVRSEDASNKYDNSPNTTHLRKDHEVTIPEFLHKLKELNNKDPHHNKTLQDLWATLQYYRKKSSDANHHKNNETDRQQLQTNDNISSHEHFQESGEIGAINTTNLDIPIRHYSSKLEQLATKLEKVVNSTDHNQTDSARNASDARYIVTDSPTEQENRNFMNVR